MDMSHRSFDVVVVGGGIAGLTAASYLARAGCQVTLVEQAGRVGGAAATLFRAGYAFNRGLHALYSGGAASEVLHELGVTYSFGVSNTMWVLDQQTLQPFPADPMALLRSSLLDPFDKYQLIHLFATLPRCVPARFARVSVEDWLAQVLKRPRPRALLAALARTFVYSSALDLVSAEVFIAKLQRTLQHPIQYINGGWQSIVDGLWQVAEQAGARVIIGTHVETLIVEAGGVVGARLRDGSVLHADAVVLATQPDDVAKLVAQTDAPMLHRALQRLVPARVACLDVALERLPNPVHPVVQDINLPRFLSAQSVYARIAPPEGAFVGVLKQLDPRCLSDPAIDECDLEDLLDTIQSGWRDVLVKRVFLPHITASGALPTVRDGGFAGRPQPRVAELTNLYVAGDWVGAEGFLVDASFASAREVAHSITHNGVERARALSALAEVRHE